MKPKTATINVFIDPELGFLKLDITDAQGGGLYVPGGEQVAPIMGDIIEKSRNTVFVIGQDYHPATHISFMTNHPGVMDYRVESYKKFLADNNFDIPADEEDLYREAQQPVHFLRGFDAPPTPFPFNELVLDENRNIIGLNENGRIRKVEIETSSGRAPTEKDRGRVIRVLDTYDSMDFKAYRKAGHRLNVQTLWTTHCVQGKDSSLYPEEMKLPKGLTDKIQGDLLSPIIYFRDSPTGNEFYVIRKGTNSELDSYGIGVENDRDTFTPAYKVFMEIARVFDSQSITDVRINVGGLASNFCVEFSANNIDDLMKGFFKMRGMNVDIRYVPEISRGIPIPGDARVPFSEAGVVERLQKSRNIGTTTVSEIMSMQNPSVAPAANNKFRP